MAYEKQTWTTGEVITQEKLNHMEDGIKDAYELPAVTETDNGKVLGVENGQFGLVNGGGSGGGADTPFVINVSDIDYENYTAVVDKTYAEALAAFNAGQPFLVVEETADIQYGRLRYCGAANQVRQIGYPNSFIEVNFLLHKASLLDAQFQIKDDGSVYYAELPIQNA